MEAKSFPGPKTDWYGFVRSDFEIDGRKCIIVEPKKVAEGNPWLWRARFFGHQPQADIALLKKGFHIAYCDVSNLFGSPKALKHWDAFYDYLDREHFFAQKVAFEGMSRGGLPSFNWAAANSTKVACLYVDAPVCDFKSWPMGNGDSNGSVGAWKLCKEAYGFKDDAEALAYKFNPIDNLEKIAKAKIPLLHVVGDADKVVPVHENTGLIERRYKDLGGDIQVIHKPGVGHHPHALKDPKPIVDFILKHTFDKSKGASLQPSASKKNIHVRGNYHNSYLKFTRENKGHVAFLGGSITQMDGYRPMVTAFLQNKFPKTDFTFTDAGMSSTCSTTGAFRLGSDVLRNGPVDLFFVEFAVNDDQDAGHSKEACIRGMEGIIRQIRKQNPYADIVMTFFINEQIREALKKSIEPLTPESHTIVAEHYGVSTIHLAAEVTEQIVAGKLTWEVFGGVHPKPFGNRICTMMIENLLNDSWATVSSQQLNPIAHDKPGPISKLSYANGRLIPVKNATELNGWKVSVPDWKSMKGAKRKDFMELDILSTETVGSTCSIEFTGVALGAFILAGPDAGIIEVSIDGGPFKSFDQYHRYSKGLHYPRTIVFAHDLKEGPHKATLRMSSKTNSAGTAMRIMYFCGN